MELPMKDREKVVYDDVFVDVKAAERQLVEWIRYDADIDDLARLLSFVCENGRVVVTSSGFSNSDQFKDGQRCKVQTTRSRKGKA
jgi:hypothetical protein